MSNPLNLPSVLPLHGDTASRLMMQQREVSLALVGALKALESAMPHGRNYLDHDEYEAARDDYYDALTTINTLLGIARDRASHWSDLIER